MSYLTPTTSLRSADRVDQGAISGESRQSPQTTSIHILDDDSLLNVFYLYRPYLLGEDGIRLMGGKQPWVGENWWHKLAHVCQRWRNIILGSASYLDACLVCTFGTPVAYMLAHSPPLPIAVDYSDEDRDVTAKDEEGAILALKQRDRVRRIHLRVPITNLPKFVVAIDEEYPILEYLAITFEAKDDIEASTVLIFPETLQAPHLRYLSMGGFAHQIGYRLLTTAVGLVTFCLCIDHPFAYLQPNTLLQWISFMPQLEALAIFLSVVPKQLTMQTPLTKPITLPNLHHFWFRGSCTYLEALVRQIATPRLEKLQIESLYLNFFPVPYLLQFINTSENLRFDSAKFEFSTPRVHVRAYPRGEPEMYALSISIRCWDLGQQVSPVAQFSNSLSQKFSAVKHLTLQCEEDRCKDRWTSGFVKHDAMGRAEWCKLLRSFSNMKTLHIDNCFIEEISRCLQVDDEEHPSELLPELQELIYIRVRDIDSAFNSFVYARRNTGHPITLVHLTPSPSPCPSPVVSPFETPSATPASSEVGSDLDT